MQAKGYTRETIRSLGISNAHIPTFYVGDVVAISQRIKEGEKERLQLFEGDVIAIHRKGASSTFMVRRIGADSVAVERIYPFYSPLIESIKVLKRGVTRRAKLYYMRYRVGKSARVQTSHEKVQEPEAKQAA
jgi:large subunit ribosomal protein L19